MRLGRLVEEERPGVAGGSGISASTTRAPSCLQPLDVRLGGAVARGSAGPPTDGGCVSSPTVKPGEPRLGHRLAGQHRPHRARRRRPSSPSARPCRSVGQSGKTPSVGIRPQLGFRPTTPQHDAGSRIEQPVSVPSADVAQPGGERGRVARPTSHPSSGPGRRGFCTVPYHGFWLVTPHANSCRFALPTTTAPARDEPLDRGRRSRRHVVGVDPRAVRRADPRGVDQVLDEQPPPVQRARHARAPARPR